MERLAQKLTKKMKKAAAELDFETAAQLRDQLMEIRKAMDEDG
jgi:excinuclease ABC subunit B